jgi:hypothetical protein
MNKLTNTSVLKYILIPIDDNDPFTASSNDLLHIPILGWNQDENHISAVTLDGVKHDYVARTSDDTRYKVVSGALTEVN